MRYSKNFRHQHANGRSTWHFEWCTKYRYKVFSSENNKNLCTIALNEAAKKAQVRLLELEVQPEHVHMIAELSLTKTPIDAIRDLKSLSARMLFALIPKLQFRYPKKKLWSKGKFAMSVGNITLEKAKEYVKNQGTHHAKSLLLTSWNLRSEAKRRSLPRRAKGLPRRGCQKCPKTLL